MTSTSRTAALTISALGLAAAVTLAPPANVIYGAVAGGPPDTLVATPAASTIGWTGTGFGERGAREGTVALASGMFVIRHERLTSGTFTIDMRSADAALRGADFLDVERHPTAVFRSTESRRIGAARWQVRGDLTMRGVTRPITFDADVSWPGMGHMVATSAFTLDRRQWGLTARGAARADDVANEGIRISLTLDARRKQAKVATR